jgi:hypothetical protein
MWTNKDVTVSFRQYGEITIPKYTELTHQTATGIDEKYRFVKDLSWIKNSYPSIANILTHDMTYYSPNIKEEDVTHENPFSRIYFVSKITKGSGNRKIIEKNLTRDEAIKIVSSFPDSTKTMYVFDKQ